MVGTSDPWDEDWRREGVGEVGRRSDSDRGEWVGGRRGSAKTRRRNLGLTERVLRGSESE